MVVNAVLLGSLGSRRMKCPAMITSDRTYREVAGACGWLKGTLTMAWVPSARVAKCTSVQKSRALKGPYFPLADHVTFVRGPTHSRSLISWQWSLYSPTRELSTNSLCTSSIGASMVPTAFMTANLSLTAPPSPPWAALTALALAPPCFLLANTVTPSPEVIWSQSPELHTAHTVLSTSAPRGHGPDPPLALGSATASLALAPSVLLSPGTTLPGAGLLRRLNRCVRSPAALARTLPVSTCARWMECATCWCCF
mmetsp:Transcript_7942/g.12147  ORF Transcript_7942/g.12147 Transcript_7942/m.12147 type:complete len:254 (+) Transcript_7942:345-1106(+)